MFVCLFGLRIIRLAFHEWNTKVAFSCFASHSLTLVSFISLQDFFLHFFEMAKLDKAFIFLFLAKQQETSWPRSPAQLSALHAVQGEQTQQQGPCLGSQTIAKRFHTQISWGILNKSFSTRGIIHHLWSDMKKLIATWLRLLFLLLPIETVLAVALEGRGCRMAKHSWDKMWLKD